MCCSIMFVSTVQTPTQSRRSFASQTTNTVHIRKTFLCLTWAVSPVDGDLKRGDVYFALARMQRCALVVFFIASEVKRHKQAR